MKDQLTTEQQAEHEGRRRSWSSARRLLADPIWMAEIRRTMQQLDQQPSREVTLEPLIAELDRLPQTDDVIALRHRIQTASTEGR